MAVGTSPSGLQTFNIHGMRLAVTAQDGWLRDGVAEALRPFRSAVDDADISMRLCAGHTSPHSVRAAGPVGPADPAGLQFRFGAMWCCRSGDQLVYSDGCSTVVLDPERRGAEGTLCRAQPAAGLRWHAWQQPVFTFPLLELLRCGGLYHVHAAALEREGMGIVLAGDSGSGKTTLALLLARAGWGFLADDAVLLRLAGDAVEARALPRPFHVDPALRAVIPELDRLPAGSYGAGPKREFCPEVAFGRPHSPSAQPRVLLFPQLHHRREPPSAEPLGPGVWLRRLGPGAAIAELIRASALVLLDARAAAGHLEALRRLATGCACYRLYHGPALLAAPGDFVALAERLLTAGIDAGS